ncbi:MAG: trypsin-like peptidase domain-containing protein [Bacteroidia bacterium]|nr:trypsin-like peptidase domain-containing protein [Bacteroidia bacterium]
MKNVWQTIFLSGLMSSLMLAGYHFSGLGIRYADYQAHIPADSSSFAVQVSDNFSSMERAYLGPVDFQGAAATAMPAVVHIKSIRTVNQVIYDPFYELFGRAPRQYNNNREQVSSGSGVIIGTDGYIVTNNHVIKDADQLTVTLYDNRTFVAKVIGTDPSTDLGLLKIEARDLPTLLLANSDEVVVGEWVLAVGNPFSLSSTATAGIISAIGRDLEIIKDQMAIESFIQTDAAVNPGNSGGALVDLQGNLIGVNTAIASPTGAYAGYAFAVPANIVKKVVSDLKTYGIVQRAFLGVVTGVNLNGDKAKELDVEVTEGVYIQGLSEIGGAYQAGLREKDVIVEIQGFPIKNDARLLEIVSRSSPGDVIQVKVIRDGKAKSFPVTLTNQAGNTDLIISNRNELLTTLGIDLRDLTEDELRRLPIDHGVLVNKLYAGKVRQTTDMPENFVILSINGKDVSQAKELIQLLEGAKGEVALKGYYPRYNRLYEYKLRIDE